MMKIGESCLYRRPSGAAIAGSACQAILWQERHAPRSVTEVRNLRRKETKAERGRQAPAFVGTGHAREGIPRHCVALFAGMAHSYREALAPARKSSRTGPHLQCRRSAYSPFTAKIPGALRQ